MKKEVLNNSLKRHVSFTACPDIHQLCEPLFKFFPIKVFEYSRVYPDGSRLELSNHHEHLENAFITRAKMSRVYTPSLIPPDQHYLFITPWIENLKNVAQKTLREQLYSQHELFSIGNEFNIINRKKNYVEIFHFYAPHTLEGIENLYLDKRDLFEKFSTYFVNEAHRLIQKADKDRIIKPWRNRFLDNVIVESDIAAAKRAAFLKSITPKRTYLMIDNREITITKREMECANLMLQGKTASEIAKQLLLSKRTVETHIEALKIKSDSNNRSDLINLLLSQGFLKSPNS